MSKFKCPCCEHLTLEDGNGNFEICPVCFWEDDPVQSDKPNMAGGANRVSLNYAQISYLLFGYGDPQDQAFVRKPLEDE